MAHIKAKGGTKLGRDSQSKRLGVKIYGGQSAKAGNIIIRQRGTSFYPGAGTLMGKDHTIQAAIQGVVRFSTSVKPKFTGQLERIRTVSVISAVSPPKKLIS